MMMSQGARFARATGGAAAVEFALVLPIFLMLVLGIADFWRICFTYNALNSAAGQAARYASLNSQDCTDSIKLVANKAMTGFLAATGSTVVVATTTTGSITTTTVSVSRPLNLIAFGWGYAKLAHSRTLSATASSARPPVSVIKYTSCTAVP